MVFQLGMPNLATLSTLQLMSENRYGYSTRNILKPPSTLDNWLQDLQVPSIEGHSIFKCTLQG